MAKSSASLRISKIYIYFAVCVLIAIAAFSLHAVRAQNKAAAETTNVSEQKQKVFNAEAFALENGLQGVVIANHRAPVVTHMVWYKVGAADEPYGSSGIAHFLEHLMFKGSKVIGGEPLGPGEFSKTVRSMAGNDNAFTSQDFTAYFQSIPVQNLETVMKMEAGRMRGMTLPEEEVLSERDVIQEERRQRTDNDPRSQFGEQMSAALFVNHPYGVPVIGWPQEIAALTREDAKNFYNRWYTPSNAILVVSGDVTVEEVKALAEKTYGTIEKFDIPPRARTQVPPMNSVTHVTLQHPFIRQPVVQKLIRVPSARTDKKQSLALEVLADIMGGGPTSRVYKSLVVEQKIATNAGLSYNPFNWDSASLWVYASPAPGVKPEDVLSALDEELRKIVNTPVSEKELADSLKRLQSAAIYARDSLTGPAMTIGRGLAAGASLDDIEYWPDRISRVTAPDIQSAAQAYLDPDNYGDRPPVTGFLLPKPSPKDEGGSL